MKLELERKKREFWLIKKRSEKKSRRIEKVRRIKIYTGIVLYWVLPLHVLCILPAGLSFDLS